MSTSPRSDSWRDLADALVVLAIQAALLSLLIDSELEPPVQRVRASDGRALPPRTVRHAVAA
ncbi:MAG TPA: hypothetical protein VFN74_04180 [Chloroflexota bacterium]|nr:hypothetical protein [Chloroflexota bacterium]